jgi:hypothetical protein|nr:MAG TPA: hypothetical protein [Caudoviricetes sp.]
MTTYRLRDRKLQQKLDEQSNGAFSEMLKTMGKFLAKKPATNVQLGESRFTVTLFKEDFEIAPEYDPNAWNSYPDVTPPEGVWMRAEVQLNDESRIYMCAAIFKDGKWCGCTGSPFSPSNRIKRYRPWD